MVQDFFHQQYGYGYKRLILLLTSSAAKNDQWKMGFDEILFSKDLLEQFAGG